MVDIAVGIPAIPRGRHPRTTLMELPFTIKTAAGGTEALAQPEIQAMLKDDFPGTHIINLTITEPSAVHTKQPITDLDQLKGLRMRAPTPSVTAMLEALGATPVGMPPGQVYESAERGVIDGNVMPWGPVGAFKLYEVFHNHLNARIDAVTMYTLINQARYNSLPPDIKKLIDDGGPYFTALWSTLWKKTDDAAIETAKKNGNHVADMPDDKRDAWRSKMKPRGRQIYRRAGKDVAERASDLRRDGRRPEKIRQVAFAAAGTGRRPLFPHYPHDRPHIALSVAGRHRCPGRGHPADDNGHRAAQREHADRARHGRHHGALRDGGGHAGDPACGDDRPARRHRCLHRPACRSAFSLAYGCSRRCSACCFLPA